MSTKVKWTLARMSDEAEQSGAGGDGRVRRRRRRWSEARKRRIVAESYQPGVSVSVVARRHDVNANQVFGWRRQYRELARVVGVFSLEGIHSKLAAIVISSSIRVTMDANPRTSRLRVIYHWGPCITRFRNWFIDFTSVGSRPN